MRALAVGAALLLSGCGRYADFTLPVLAGGNPHLTFQWEAQPQPVLTREQPSESHDVLNPSVAGRDMFYSAFDGQTWRTLRAQSDDGVHWRKLGEVLAPDPRTWEGSYIAANGSVLVDGPGFLYWYVGGPKERPAIGLARSSEGAPWAKEPRPVIEPGPYRSWDEEGVADPYVIRAGPYFYLYFLGQDRARRQRLGLARSTDGVHWEKLRSNPILELGGAGAFDENGLGEPAVWSAQGFYWMLYTGRDAGEMRRIGLARSTDGVHWQKLPAVFAGAEPWDSQVICDPTVDASGTRVWFGGGNAPRPDENLNGQIGVATLQAVDDTVGK